MAPIPLPPMHHCPNMDSAGCYISHSGDPGPAIEMCTRTYSIGTQVSPVMSARNQERKSLQAGESSQVSARRQDQNWVGLKDREVERGWQHGHTQPVRLRAVRSLLSNMRGLD